MNDNARLWVEALRSGKYKQGRGYLKLGEGDDAKYCCLGVACELYQQEVGGLRVSAVGDASAFGEAEFVGALPDVVRSWLNLRNNMGIYDNSADLKALYRHNDSDKWDFNQIADLIESEPEGLFTDAQPQS